MKSWIKALSMLLSLSLLIRAIIQYRMREGLKKFNNENLGVKLRAGWGGRILENYAWSSVETRERVETLLNLMKITLNDLLE